MEMWYVSMEMWFDRCAWLCVLIKVRYEPVLARGCTGQFVLPDLVDVDLDPCYNTHILKSKAPGADVHNNREGCRIN